MYYSCDIEDLLKEFNSSMDGLSLEEVDKKRIEYGYNVIPKKKKKTILECFFDGFKDPIVLLLIGVIVISFISGETTDAIAISLIVLLDVIMGTFEEYRALVNAEALSSMLEVEVKVLRNKDIYLANSKELVPGDIVMLESGDKISADMRIISSSNLTIDEAALTGESLPVMKKADKLENVNLTDRYNMLYAGTAVLTGRAKALVIATASNTEIGKIASKVNETEEEKSPLTIRMEKFSKQISISILVVALILAILLYIKGEAINMIFTSVIALSVSAMPEGLPLALTMALTIASNRMLKKKVIVKKLNSVESLGSCTVIASDKTGTLTLNEQTAKKIVLKDGSTYFVDGNGYNDNGYIVDQDEKVNLVVKYGAINNEATFKREKDAFIYSGDLIDVAFLALASKGNIVPNVDILKHIPYESENQYSAVFFKENDTFVTVKGSFEKVLSFCKKEDVDTLKKQNDALAADGYRVIALASKKITDKDEYSDKDLCDLEFLGMVAFIDPIRSEVKSSLEEAKGAGIKVVMITGDHPLTAFSIAKDLSLADSFDAVATSKELDDALNTSVEAFDELVKKKTVFTRVTPIQKLEIVASYKRQNEFVAVTGDGVNDAPALKSANIGIAMGSGSDVAKETANMIIIDDNFKSIVAGIKEGRGAYSNIRKVSYMLLSCGIAEVLFFALAIFFNLPLPLIAIQLLWLNVVTDGLQDIALSCEKSEDEIMLEKPRHTKESLFDRELIKEILVSGLVIGILVFTLWWYLISIDMELPLARAYVMTLMVFIQNIHVLNCRSERKSFLATSIKDNPLILLVIFGSILLQILVLEIPHLRNFFQVSSVPALHIFYLFVTSLVILLVMEIYKKINKK